MNLRRTLSNHQLYYLQQIAKGNIIIVTDPEFDTAPFKGKDISHWDFPMSKMRGHRALWGGHEYSSIVEMKQRGLLVDHEGRLVPCKEAQKQFGKPPPLVLPKKKPKMSRTRAARVQM